MYMSTDRDFPRNRRRSRKKTQQIFAVKAKVRNIIEPFGRVVRVKYFVKACGLGEKCVLRTSLSLLCLKVKRNR